MAPFCSRPNKRGSPKEEGLLPSLPLLFACKCTQLSYYCCHPSSDSASLALPHGQKTNDSPVLLWAFSGDSKGIQQPYGLCTYIWFSASLAGSLLWGKSLCFQLAIMTLPRPVCASPVNHLVAYTLYSFVKRTMPNTDCGTRNGSKITAKIPVTIQLLCHLEHMI